MRAAIMSCLFAAACGGTAPQSAPPDEPPRPEQRSDDAPPPAHANERLRPENHCTERPPGGESECTSRDCEWTAPLICRGVDVGNEVRERERQRYEAGVEACTCVCPADRTACAMVP